MSTSTKGVTKGERSVPSLDKGQLAERRQNDSDQVKFSASKPEIRLRFRRLGEEGEEDCLRFFRTREPAAEGGRTWLGRNNRCDAMHGV